MAKSPVFKKCGCRTAVTDEHGEPVLGNDGKPKMRRLGADCPQLRRASGWNPRHGTWHFQIEINAGSDAGRQHLGQGGIATQDEAEEMVDRIRRLVAIADEYNDDPEAATALRLQIIERIRRALKGRAPLPDYDEVQRAAKAGQPIADKITVGQWLTEWLAGKGNLTESTKFLYRSHIDIYLIPHLGQIPLDRLRTSHVHAMFAAIAADAARAPAANAARRAAEQAAKQAWKDSDPAAVKAAREQLATMPPYRRPCGPASRQRIRGTLRSALTSACAQQLITINVAALAELQSGKRPKARVWTDERVAHWKATGERPSAVMVWTAPQTVTFLERATGHELHALFHLIAFTGLRRGEACGLRWIDLDLSKNTMTVAQQIVQIGWGTSITAPKSDAGGRDVALDGFTGKILTAHRREQKKAKLAYGPGWVDTGLVFTNPDGSPLHPAHVSDQFVLLASEAGLPPIRLHDLRHGAATHALSAGVDVRLVQEMLGHSSSTITRDTYQSVVNEAKHAAAAAIADAINGTGLKYTGTDG